MHTDGTHRWRARPLLALATRGLAVTLPIAVSASAVYGASLLVPPPRGALVAYLVWWLGLSAGAMLALVATGRLTRRLLPLATLMRLSLLFPDGAPSRFGLALRTGTVESLEARLAAAKSQAAGRTPAEAASALLGLVAMLDTHDRLTRGHSERVRAYAQAIGRELGLERRELDLLNWSALLHDVGKLEVPGEILTKDGPPSPAEWELLERHPELGEALVEPLRGWLGEWAQAVVEHHERWDGRGYPHGLAKHEISLAGRIVAVADVFDVITSERSYKKAFAPAEAREEITRCAGTQFDPEVVRALLAISVRRTRATGALAWLAQAPVLGRLVLVPAATTATAAAVAVGTVTGPAPAEPARARPQVAPPAPAAVASAAAPRAGLARTRARPSAAPASPRRSTQPEPSVDRTEARPEPVAPATSPPPAAPAPPATAPAAGSEPQTAAPVPAPVPPPAVVVPPVDDPLEVPLLPLPSVPTLPTDPVLGPLTPPALPSPSDVLPLDPPDTGTVLDDPVSALPLG
jgi:hypothetical protein